MNVQMFCIRASFLRWSKLTYVKEILVRFMSLRCPAKVEFKCKVVMKIPHYIQNLPRAALFD